MTALLAHHAAWLVAHPERTAEWLAEVCKLGFDVHHLDGDHANNDPGNLILVEHNDHMRLHGLPFTASPLWQLGHQSKRNIRAAKNEIAQAIKGNGKLAKLLKIPKDNHPVIIAPRRLTYDELPADIRRRVSEPETRAIRDNRRDPAAIAPLYGLTRDEVTFIQRRHKPVGLHPASTATQRRADPSAALPTVAATSPVR